MEKWGAAETSAAASIAALLFGCTLVYCAFVALRL
jgi:hypothetical protein